MALSVVTRLQNRHYRDWFGFKVVSRPKAKECEKGGCISPTNHFDEHDGPIRALTNRATPNHHTAKTAPQRANLALDKP